MKSLYTVLGVPVDARPQQIEEAFAGALEALSVGDGKTTSEDRQIRLLALKEAYRILSDPIRRQAYNQRLFAPVTAPAVALPAEHIAVKSFWTARRLLFVASAVMLAIVFYALQNAREAERGRVEREKAAAQKALKQKDEEDARLAYEKIRREQFDRQVEAVREQQRRDEAEQFRRQVDVQVRQIAIAEQRKMEQEKRDAEIEKRNREIELQREQQRRIYELQRLERANYGR